MDQGQKGAQNHKGRRLAPLMWGCKMGTMPFKTWRARAEVKRNALADRPVTKAVKVPKWLSPI